MQLFHGGDLSAKITEDGPFAGFLFCSGEERSANSHGANLYTVDVANLAVTDPRRWQYSSDEDITAALEAEVAAAMALLGCDEDSARDALCDIDNDFVSDFQCNSSDAWTLQRMTLQIARAAGYAVVMMRDEHGVSYAVDALCDGVNFVAC